MLLMSSFASPAPFAVHSAFAPRMVVDPLRVARGTASV